MDPEPNQMMTCPYNPAHQVEHYRFHLHLQKCRKQYPNSPTTICPFDATHIVNSVELEWHIQTCPKRIMFDSQRYQTDDIEKPAVELVTPPPVVQSTENWEDDNVTSYRPDPAALPNHVLRKVRGAAPAERRKARMEGIKNYRPANQE